MDDYSRAEQITDQIEYDIEEYKSILKELNISGDRYIHIIRYIQQMLRDYKLHPVDIMKEIPLNLKGNERYVAVFIVGRSLSSLFYKMNDKEKTEFVVNIANALKFSEDRVAAIAEYMTIIKERMRKNAPVDVIKMIINNQFMDTEKDYMLFIFGIVWI